ncbi:MAG: class I SAM-dependent methyltransferase [Myxococcales bacterium]|nr:class I SAM-dependent methyltransferase [Myxococcales bacterium]MCB9547292.1 class I SAM-dependent methyltransferase [Myxococcales bacterium]
MKREYPETPAAWREFAVAQNEDELRIGGWLVMHTWERALMAALAEAVTRGSGDVLEVGFGMGISASAIVARGCRSYTCIEAHPVVAAQARAWGAQQTVPVTVLEGFWEEQVQGLGAQYDGVLFDTYPLTPAERNRNHFPFIPVATRLLRPGGVFTCYSDETVDFRAEHLHLLLQHFRRVELLRVEGLAPPPDPVGWSADHMVIPIASEPVRPAGG